MSVEIHIHYRPTVHCTYVHVRVLYLVASWVLALVLVNGPPSEAAARNTRFDRVVRGIHDREVLKHLWLQFLMLVLMTIIVIMMAVMVVRAGSGAPRLAVFFLDSRGV